MGQKILITGIGIGRLKSEEERTNAAITERKYQKATYFIENTVDRQEYQTEFVAKALVDHYQIDKVYFIGTAKSMWEEMYLVFTQESNLVSDEHYYIDLAEKVEQSNYQKAALTASDLVFLNQAIDVYLGCSGSQCFLIKYGLNTEELLFNFAVFQKIADLLQDGDEIYLDITHSFRSLALFQYTMINYIENLAIKKITINSVFYGMLDIQREMGNKAPIVDLKAIYDLSKWTKAIHELEDYGNGYLIADLIEAEDKKLAKKIRLFSDLMNINYLTGIRQQQDELAKANFSNIPAPGQMVSEYISNYIQRFSDIKKDSDFQLEMTIWYFEHKRYATGYIIMAESIVTKVCELLEISTKDKDNRNKAKNKILNRNDNGPAGELKGIYKAVREIRNNIAHALDEKDKTTLKSDIDNGFNRYKKLQKIYHQLTKTDFIR